MSERIDGWLFEAGRSAAQAVTLTVDAMGFASLSDPSGKLVRSFPWGEARIDDRIGDTARCIALADGAMIEIRDSTALDAMERGVRYAGAKQRRSGGFIAALERRWGAAVAAVLLTIVAAWAIVQSVVPVAADFVAMRIPPEIAARMDRPIVEALGKMGMGESTLPLSRRKHIEVVFDSIVVATPEWTRWHYALVFRNGGRIGANAFALPGGTVVVTDRLIEVARSDAQIAAVFAHEIGHVEGRHGLKRLARNVGLGAFTLYLFGDVTNLSHIIASVPVLLVDAAYSRDFESAADAAAVGYLKRAFFPPHALIEMLDILSRDCGARCDGPGWLSNHPLTPERIATLRALIEAY